MRRAGERRRSTLATALALTALVSARPAAGFEIPGLARLFGASDPLGAFPDTLPSRPTLELGFDAEDIYHSQRGLERHAYAGWSGWTLALAPVGRATVGVRFQRDHLNLMQAEVWGHHDRLEGGRDLDHVSVALAGRLGAWEARGLVGGSVGPEAALAVRGELGPLERVEGRLSWWRSRLDLAETIEGTTFFFPFEYRDENAMLAVALRPLWGKRLALGIRREVAVGEKLDAEQYNLPYMSRWRGDASLQDRKRRLDAAFFLDDMALDLAMALQGTHYLDAHDLRVRRWGGELGWRPRTAIRVAAGFDSWKLASTDPSYFDVWPFTVWDVFTATRFRLESLDKHWTIAYARLGAARAFGHGVSLAFDTRLESWRDSGTLLWKERVPAVWPVFFRFEHHQDSLDWRFEYGVQVDATLRWRLRPDLELDVSGRALAPFGHDAEPGSGDGGPPPPAAAPEPSLRAHGGLRLVTVLRLAV